MRKFLALLFAATFGVALSGCGVVSNEAHAESDSRRGPAAAAESRADNAPQTVTLEIDKWRACVAPIHDQVNDAASHVQELLPRPANIRQLLQNLKTIEEQDLVCNAGLLDGSTLERAFAGVTETRKPKPGYMNAKDAYVGVSIHSEEFPGITVDVEGSCSSHTVKDDSGTTKQETSGIGTIVIRVNPDQQITVSDVRSVFGMETHQFIDRGVDPDGNEYTPQEKGGVVYERPIKGRPDDRKRTTFYLRLGPSQNSGDDLIARGEYQSIETRFGEIR